jgi:hypothetical protein
VGDDAGAAEGAVGDVEGSSVVASGRSGDGEAEAGSTDAAGAGVVESGEAFEDVVALVGGDPRAVVGSPTGPDIAPAACPAASASASRSPAPW